ncbi:MAG TPA: DNA methyltransferase [Minicystis sp.]|nr:DNA methyltransferase [Minicystis sp.]
MTGAAAPHLLYAGDALDACGRAPAHVDFDLVYLDPPYGIGRAHAGRRAKGEHRARVAKGEPAAYADVDGPDALVEMLAPRLAAIRARMSARATLWLHLDHRAVHEAKLLCDRVFGRGAFLGEVVWVPGNGGRGARLSVTHQTLLLYARSAADAPQTTWNGDDPILREPFAGTSQRMHFTKVDADGRRYRERVVGGKAYRYYADVGRRLGSVWTDIPAMHANTPLRRETTGYPTQKPERLLERIVRATSRAGDTVADLMCGSGTTLVVAARLGRRFVGGDASPVALEITRARLAAAAVSFAE